MSLFLCCCGCCCCVKDEGRLGHSSLLSLEVVSTLKQQVPFLNLQVLKWPSCNLINKDSNNLKKYYLL